jgi:spore maturation protein SpmB
MFIDFELTYNILKVIQCEFQTFIKVLTMYFGSINKIKILSALKTPTQK